MTTTDHQSGGQRFAGPASGLVTTEAVVAAIETNGWREVFRAWFVSYNQQLPDEHVDKAVDAYITVLAGDIITALT